MFIDCSKIAKAKTDAAVINELSDQTGGRFCRHNDRKPLTPFSLERLLARFLVSNRAWYIVALPIANRRCVQRFMNNISGLIDLAAVGLIGQKAGFATPLDQQIKQVLEVVGSALKETSESRREAQKDAIIKEEEAQEEAMAKVDRAERIKRGIWHDGRLDCVAGNGVMSELGLGEEELTENDTVMSIAQVETPSSNASTDPLLVDPLAIKSAIVQKQASEVDAERDYTESLPILVLDNFTQKTNTKPEIWNVLAEWAAGLVENKVGTCNAVF